MGFARDLRDAGGNPTHHSWQSLEMSTVSSKFVLIEMVSSGAMERVCPSRQISNMVLVEN